MILFDLPKIITNKEKPWTKKENIRKKKFTNLRSCIHMEWLKTIPYEALTVEMIGEEEVVKIDNEAGGRGQMFYVPHEFEKRYESIIVSLLASFLKLYL